MRFARRVPPVVLAGIVFALPWLLAGEPVRQAPQSAPPGDALSIALPDGEGKSLVTGACGGCHEPALVMFTREDEEGWAVIVNSMAARGARATPSELATITAYLAAHFNRQSKFAPLQAVGAGAANARDEQQLFAAGKEVYGTLCAVCHQADGRGRDKIAPPLVSSDLALGAPAIPIRIMLHGKRGPANVMPALGALISDAQIAAVLTYVRRKWGQRASPIDAAAVEAVRTATAGRARPWTSEELSQVAAQSGKGEGYE